MGDELALEREGGRYRLSLTFDVPVPSPESHDIALDLARALVEPGRPPLPLIRFVPVRWSESYN